MREQRHGVDLEVQMDGRELGVAGLPHEAEHVAGLDLPAVDGERRVRREMGVVELVPGAVAEPEAPAADVVPADREHRAVGDGEERRPERREDVLAVVPAAGDVARGRHRTCRRTTPARRPGRRSRRSVSWAVTSGRAGRARAGAPGIDSAGLAGRVRRDHDRDAPAAESPAGFAGGDRESRSVPRPQRPRSLADLDRAAGRKAAVVRDQLDAKRRDRRLRRPGGFCAVSIDEPSTSRLPQSASGTTAFADGVISCPSTVRPVSVDCRDVARGARRARGDARAHVERRRP